MTRIGASVHVPDEKTQAWAGVVHDPETVRLASRVFKTFFGAFSKGAACDGAQCRKKLVEDLQDLIDDLRD